MSMANPVSLARVAKAHPVGVRHFVWQDTATGGDARPFAVALWYPSRADRRLPKPYMGVLPAVAVEDADPLPVASPLAVISHGYGGARFDQAFLAEYLAANGIACLTVTHADTAAGPTRWHHLLQRPRQFAAAVRTLREAVDNGSCAVSIDWEQVILVGHSAGAYSALVGAGANPRFDQEPEFAGIADLQAFAADRHRVDGVRAVVLLAPALSNLFDADGLRPVACPALVVAAEHETTRLLGSVDAYARLLADVRYATLEGAGHYAFVNVCPPSLCRLAPTICGGDTRPRGELHRTLLALLAAFLADALVEEPVRRRKNG